MKTYTYTVHGNTNTDDVQIVKRIGDQKRVLWSGPRCDLQHAFDVLDEINNREKSK